MNDKGHTVKVERRFDFPAEAVFDAWLDSSALGRWFFATPGGAMKKVKLDARVGGEFEIVEQRGDIDARHVGTYLEIDRPRQLVFEFSAGAADEPLHAPTRVTMEINPDGAGCVLTLTHEGVWDGFEERTQQGWTMILENLGKTLGGAL